MAEWSKAAVLKTVEGNTSVGSNPTPSASKIAPQFYIKKFCKNFFGEMAELAEGARLLSECGGKLPPRVRIPLSPPQTMIEVNLRFLRLTFFHAASNSRAAPGKNHRDRFHRGNG
jgi:hypothetical protein